jgi:hypothetical protein
MQSRITKFVRRRFAHINLVGCGIFAALLLFVLATGCSSSQPQPHPGTMPAVLLHQPDPILSERLKDAKAFAAYIQRIQAECDSYFRRARPRGPQTLDVVVLLKPGNRDRFWLVYDPPQTDQAPDRALLKNLQAIYPSPVEKGPVSFSLRFLLWGATEPDARGPRGPLLPQEWRDVIGTNQSVVIPDGIIPKVWPDK